jgi:hypothetical protein
MITFWEKLFQWLERVFPTALAAFGLGYKAGSSGKQELETKLAETEYELEKKKNSEEVRRKYEGKTARDIVSDFFSRRKR